MKEVKKNERGNVILALALIKHLHNSGKLPEHVYLNIKREYESNMSQRLKQLDFLGIM